MQDAPRYVLQPTAAGHLPWMVRGPNGEWVRCTDHLRQQRRYRISLIINLIVVLMCALLVAYLVTHKYDPQPVQVPIGAGERAAMLAEIQAVTKQRDDLKALTLNYKAQVKRLNASISDDAAKVAALEARGQEISRQNREMAQRMGTTQGVVLEAKRVLGGSNVKIIER